MMSPHRLPADNDCFHYNSIMAHGPAELVHASFL